MIDWVVFNTKPRSLYPRERTGVRTE